eukprot:CAMPEP_0206815290 /NCGR_PEP_ID=MMETSP0975-20121206/9213_1 /ASSEMBLY_ACC=CAM_ASM_000399 /TAXON_ID=483370 /ORGANISM="non described non described, Strain CCMP2097" /LENGTH=245 /DNA_ID=CAMNT_0054357471 /DNA_START=78 /DNA_END=813 /DNA_ORIENTATION=+
MPRILGEQVASFLGEDLVVEGIKARRRGLQPVVEGPRHRRQWFQLADDAVSAAALADVGRVPEGGVAADEDDGVHVEASSLEAFEGAESHRDASELRVADEDRLEPKALMEGGEGVRLEAALRRRAQHAARGLEDERNCVELRCFVSLEPRADARGELAVRRHAAFLKAAATCGDAARSHVVIVSHSGLHRFEVRRGAAAPQRGLDEPSGDRRLADVRVRAVDQRRAAPTHAGRAAATAPARPLM